MSLITPRTLKGFRDLMPAQARRRSDLVRALEDVFRSHGYGPLETPAIELAEILTGKGGEDTDKELFAWTDKGGRDVALRFDLTVPLARFVAQHQGQLIFPFRRYAMGPVWRGERPQRGRFREFWQCDADIIGPISTAADAEIVLVLLDAYASLGVGDEVTLRVNDRRVLNGLLEQVGVEVDIVPVLRALDKREKQGDAVVREGLEAAGLATDAAATLLDATVCRDSNDATLDALEATVGTSEVGRAGVAALREVLTLVAAAGGRADRIRIDPGIARGLDYYTGIVFEAQYDALPEIGSVGSGGRYDDLAGLYTKTSLPGVGCSVGIDRLIAALEAKDEAPSAAAAQVMVAHPDQERLGEAFAVAGAVRSAGYSVEVFPHTRKHDKQMRYADRHGIAVAVTLDQDGHFFAKRLADGASTKAADIQTLLGWLEAHARG